MDDIKCAIGTMAWGKSTYEKIILGSSVDETILKQTIDEARSQNLLLLDTAHKYGIGYSEKFIGNYAPKDMMISTKYSPGKGKKRGQVEKDLLEDLSLLKRDYVDLYWLHMPIKIEENLEEIINLVKKGLVKNVGVSNCNLSEIKLAKEILNRSDVELYGVQNHFSLISRDWEKNGTIDWCKANGIKFYAWSVMEEGSLLGKTHYKGLSLKSIIYNKRVKHLKELFTVMKEVALKYNISMAQLNIAWAISKGVIPVCGCRKPFQVKELSEALSVKLSGSDIGRIEETAEKSGVSISGDPFRKFNFIYK